MNTGLSAFLNDKLTKVAENGNLRSLKVSSGLFDFCSNDYLGFARSSELHQLNIKALAALEPPYNGSTGSRLLSGNSHSAEELERYLAGILKSEATLLFNSGYAANIAVLSALPQKGHTIIYDELAHACIKDGARLSLATHYNFRHNDPNDLEKKLKLAQGRKWIVVESIYSMDGDICALGDVARLAAQYDAVLVVDEAHSTGNMGPNGAGLTVQFNLQDKVDIRIHTFGKAMGAHGACVASSKPVIDYLINFARPFIYTTAPSPHEVISIRNAFDYLGRNPVQQEQLNKNITAFQELMNDHQQPLSPIYSFVVGGNAKTKAAAEHLQKKGYDVRPILSPTVKAGSERLRICLHTFNTLEEMKGLTSELSSLKS